MTSVSMDSQFPGLITRNMFELNQVRQRQLCQELTAAAALDASYDPERFTRLQYYASPEMFLPWCLYYLKKAFTFPFEQHHEIEAQCLFLKGQLVVVLLPRGYGKTTLLDAWTIWSICYGYDPLLVRMEYDLPTAKSKSLLVDKYCFTGLIAQDYQLERGDVWRPNSGELHIRNRRNPFAKAHDISLRCAGARSIYQGSTFDFSRISTVIINDIIKNSLEANSASWNNFIYSMLKNDILYAGGSFVDGSVTVLFITTIQAEYDISHRLSEDSAAVVFRHKALTGTEEDAKEFVAFVAQDAAGIRAERDRIQGTPPNLTGVTFEAEHLNAYCEERPAYQEWFRKLRSTWPAKFPMYAFVWEINQSGPQIFLRLRQHITGDESTRKFLASWWVPYIDLSYDYVFSGNIQCGVFVDPSAKAEDFKQVNDPQAIVVKLYDPMTRDQYYLWAWSDYLTPVKFIYKLWEIVNSPIPFPSCQTLRIKDIPGCTVIFESNAAQAFGLDLIEMVRSQEEDYGALAAYPKTDKYHAQGDFRPVEFRDPAYWSPVDVTRWITRSKKLERIGGDLRRGYIEGLHMHVLPGQSMQDHLVSAHTRYKGIETHGNKFIFEEKIDILDADSFADEWFDCYVEISDDDSGILHGADPLTSLS